ncbi:DMT family transporter [Nocardia concava]|uniref:DMT family transporter n=1 Tax=Nocardia concava TaxID=257281 RepID=UPI0002F49418|nr:DMT family transporter [Nocardia concava]
MLNRSAFRRRGSWTAIALLIAVTAVWGATFTVVQAATDRMPVLDFLAVRFGLAAAILLVLRPSCLIRLSRSGLVRGVLLGVLLGGTYLLQTYGLRYTPATISAFITGMFVVFTPLMASVVLRKQIGVRVWAATGIAAVGLAFLSLHGFSIGFGELLTLGCALCLAGHIVGLGEWSVGHDPYALALVQMATVAVICGLAALPSGLRLVPPDRQAWEGVLITAVLATAVAFVIQTWAQARLSASRTAIVLTMEPVFAAVTGALTGERITVREIVGSLLVLAAMYLVELRPAEPDSNTEAVAVGPADATNSSPMVRNS